MRFSGIQDVPAIFIRLFFNMTVFKRLESNKSNEIVRWTKVQMGFSWCTHIWHDRLTYIRITYMVGISNGQKNKQRAKPVICLEISQLLEIQIFRFRDRSGSEKKVAKGLPWFRRDFSNTYNMVLFEDRFSEFVTASARRQTVVNRFYRLFLPLVKIRNRQSSFNTVKKRKTVLKEKRVVGGVF